MSFIAPVSVSPHQHSQSSTTQLASSPIIVSVNEHKNTDNTDTSKSKQNSSIDNESSLSKLIGQFMDIKSLHPVVKSFLVGSISGTCSTILFQPLDLLKTRIQTPHASIGHGQAGSGIFSVAGHILRHENFFGLWKGMTPSLTRCVPGVGIYFAYIHGMKITLEIDDHPTAIQSMLLGVSGRCFSGAIMIPFTVIKTRFESKVYQYGSIREALRKIYRSEGVRGLTCGLLPTLLRDAPFSGLYLMMYNSTKQSVPQEWIDSNTFGPSVRFSCGIISGFGASIVTQPADVIKTKMQLFPNKFQTVFQVVLYIYQKYGLNGYFKGLMPRTIRRTLVAAMSWTVYEQVMKSVGLK